jgi:hypothetical protein
MLLKYEAKVYHPEFEHDAMDDDRVSGIVEIVSNDEPNAGSINDRLKAYLAKKHYAKVENVKDLKFGPAYDRI